jgi:hypothetical protein
MDQVKEGLYLRKYSIWKKGSERAGTQKSEGGGGRGIGDSGKEGRRMRRWRRDIGQTLVLCPSVGSFNTPNADTVCLSRSDRQPFQGGTARVGGWKSCSPHNKT